MADYTITLSEQTYQRLLMVAEEHGVSPEHWIASQLSSSPSTRSPALALADLIGAIDSTAEPHAPTQKNTFGEGIAKKLADQGIQKP